MKKVSLSGSPRENVGKQDAKRLRREGLVPVVLYGGKNQLFASVKHIDLEKIIISPDVFHIELSMEDKKYSCIVQEVQFHPVTDEILHVDLLDVFADKPVVVPMPIRLVGNSIGVKNGGRLLQNLRKIRVRALVDDIPDYIEIDITKLRIGKAIRIEDLNFPKLEFLQSPNAVVVAVKTARAAIVDDVEEDEDEEGEETAEGAEAAEGETAAAEGGDGGEDKKEEAAE